ncbi:hypothetical protein [Zhouia amylolytica]|uniref:Uncharacterized protein n=1 Tax=Zhouia amylolytica AD3 TaxID=1286632 RepID=W2US33_9FLAO|nr:hypothetical protein [Zhouia amylolytica]ETN96147.1 hypothetical protein P278_09480 [Zhouia amylolytica AD3]
MQIRVTYDKTIKDNNTDKDLRSSYIVLDKNKIAIYYGIHRDRRVHQSIKTNSQVRYTLEESVINEKFLPARLSTKEQKQMNVNTGFKATLPYFSYPELYFDLTKSQQLILWCYNHFRLLLMGLCGLLILTLALIILNQ